jgi:hypothetical protein
MPSVAGFLKILGETVRDVLPIAAVLTVFQLFVLRKTLPNPKRLLLGFTFVLAGLVLFLMGLEQALFPVGKTMAAQFTAPEFLGADGEGNLAGADPWAYVWVYAFAFAIGFSKAEKLSAGAINAWSLRIAVALGVAIGISLGAFRIVVGVPLHYFIMGGYVVVVVQTLFAPKRIVPLAYDSGGVTTSTVTVPLVAALGLGLAESIPGRSTLIDGFGLIAFASLFPMITVMAYAQASQWRDARNRSRSDRGSTDQVTSVEDRP